MDDIRMQCRGKGMGLEILFSRVSGLSVDEIKRI
jgi:hypothetical protein